TMPNCFGRIFYDVLTLFQSFIYWHATNTAETDRCRLNSSGSQSDSRTTDRICWSLLPPQVQIYRRLLKQGQPQPSQSDGRLRFESGRAPGFTSDRRG